MKTNAAPTQEEIARCAFAIYESEGRPANRALAHWLEAEAHLLAIACHEADPKEWTTDGSEPAGDGRVSKVA